MQDIWVVVWGNQGARFEEAKWKWKHSQRGSSRVEAMPGISKEMDKPNLVKQWTSFAENRGVFFFRDWVFILYHVSDGNQ